jgi:hypothetical protein
MIVEMMLQYGYDSLFEVVVTVSRGQSPTKPVFHSLGFHFCKSEALFFGLGSLEEKHPRISPKMVTFISQKLQYWMEQGGRPLSGFFCPFT